MVVEKVKGLPKGQGYKAATGEYVDMVKSPLMTGPTGLSAVRSAARLTRGRYGQKRQHRLACCSVRTRR